MACSLLYSLTGESCLSPVEGRIHCTWRFRDACKRIKQAVRGLCLADRMTRHLGAAQEALARLYKFHDRSGSNFPDRRCYKRLCRELQALRHYLWEMYITQKENACSVRLAKTSQLGSWVSATPLRLERCSKPWWITYVTPENKGSKDQITAATLSSIAKQNHCCAGMGMALGIIPDVDDDPHWME